MIRWRRLVLSLLVLVALVGVPEIALRIAGFRNESGIQFGFPRPAGFAAFARDDKLFWKLHTPTDSHKDGIFKLGNSMGLPGPDPERPKPSGLLRLLFLGDSCTYDGWPILAAEALTREGTRTESVLLAVPRYSSYQGRVAAELYARDLEPDVEFVFFGWNDHWAAYRSTDEQKAARGASSFVQRVAVNAREASRVVQAVSWLRDRLGGAERPLGVQRVPPDGYRSNLRRIRSLFAAANTPTVFVTAPTSFYRAGVPPELIELQFAPDAETAIRLHRQYNEIVREVARETGAVLLDLEAECEAREDVATLFGVDGIHYTDAGRVWIAARAADAVREIRSHR